MINFIKNNAKIYMILSICVLIGTIGVTYAYYTASISNNTSVTGSAGGGELPTLTIARISEEADGNLIPVDMDADTLSKAASRNPKCIDNNGYSACQIYSVTVTNNSDISQSYNIKLTSLSGTNTPNVDAVTMGTSSTSVSSAASIKKDGLICKTNSIENGETTTACYFMVLIKNLEGIQTDSGTFTGTVTVTSSVGAEVKADFGASGELTTYITSYITSLYTNGNLNLITQYDTDGNSVNDYYYSYQDTTQTWGLMNDGFKIDTTLDSTTTSLAIEVTDTTALTSGTSGNIRYFGPSDSVNNYIYFNCDDYSN